MLSYFILSGLQARVQGVLQGEKCRDKDRGHVDFQALQKGNTEGAQIYAQNAIRKKTEGLNLLRLASRIDAVASRVETAVTMRSVTNSMGSVVKGMDKAMESMNLERVSCFLFCYVGSKQDRGYWARMCVSCGMGEARTGMSGMGSQSRLGGSSLGG
jgi:hypothetical protein